ncbi:hypothetical protein [Streptomyces sp. Isolate_219]|uniref:hypothetical protein n=1 Tax=Streptomyces sp. Isolate_219 TaxID=2950110 RepID=UPI0021C983A3|nr:hypothetical protein [Streptomyces sp. Isolate_219]MCR8577078.1 hypothetical protein [Streptomyces sp. Isolate_219]
MCTPGSPTTPAATQKCSECRELERGQKQAEAERDLSRVTDFNVLIVRHRMTHPAGP